MWQISDMWRILDFLLYTCQAMHMDSQAEGQTIINY